MRSGAQPGRPCRLRLGTPTRVASGSHPSHQLTGSSAGAAGAPQPTPPPAQPPLSPACPRSPQPLHTHLPGPLSGPHHWHISSGARLIHRIQGCTGSGPPAPVVIWGGRRQPQLRPPPPPARSGPRSANTSLAAHEALPASGRWGLHSAPVTEPAPLRQPAPLQEFSAQSATGYAPRASDPFRFMKD
ncbi:hypothetical protein NDU88_003164 [Pleurodeles waltl]|uniref:Uncharacterized protein n=1 Tax=Pleurodeles waltl TaxID=8319 RepID=A0AAV7VD90_PLEWA|nr:hypothetical protein NDU88_003164 [Pleurodeles waltl]